MTVIIWEKNWTIDRTFCLGNFGRFINCARLAVCGGSIALFDHGLHFPSQVPALFSCLMDVKEQCLLVSCRSCGFLIGGDTRNNIQIVFACTILPSTWSDGSQ